MKKKKCALHSLLYTVCYEIQAQKTFQKKYLCVLAEDTDMKTVYDYEYNLNNYCRHARSVRKVNFLTLLSELRVLAESPTGFDRPELLVRGEPCQVGGRGRDGAVPGEDSHGGRFESHAVVQLWLAAKGPKGNLRVAKDGGRARKEDLGLSHRCRR